MQNHEVNKGLIKQRFGQSVARYNEAAVVQKYMALRLAGLLSEFAPDLFFRNVLELGCGTGFVPSAVLSRAKVEKWIGNDIAGEFKKPFMDVLRSYSVDNVEFLEGDMEKVDLPKNQNLIISNASLHWLNSPDTLISSLVDKLVPEGLLVFSCFGEDNLREMRAMTNYALRYPVLADYENLLGSLGELLHAEQDIMHLDFKTPLAVLRHLKDTGTNALRREPWTPGKFHKFSERYEHQFGNGESVQLTYHPMYFVLRKTQE